MSKLTVTGKSLPERQVLWDPDNEHTVQKAITAFDSLKQQGYTFYRIKRVTVEERGESIDHFDPADGEILAVPPMQGG